MAVERDLFIRPLVTTSLAIYRMPSLLPILQACDSKKKMAKKEYTTINRGNENFLVSVETVTSHLPSVHLHDSTFLSFSWHWVVDRAVMGETIHRLLIHHLSIFWNKKVITYISCFLVPQTRTDEWMGGGSYLLLLLSNNDWSTVGYECFPVGGSIIGKEMEIRPFLHPLTSKRFLGRY